MGYQALLFCPDDKTARSVSQVLAELEFTVEPCTETYAAVKKLMGAHFDAVVVDCDNEQNATLLFKSARNSTSNQTSLAVAVVEGQAGVAKAFRIGANLVLTKPINIEQAKGTLRVARGLLRKSEAGKAAAGTVAAAAPVTPAQPAKPASAAKPAVAKAPTNSPAAAPAPRVLPPTSKPAWPGAAAATAETHPAASDKFEDHSQSVGAEVPYPSALKPAPALAQSEPKASVSQSLKAATASLTSGAGTASAPARAREAQSAPAISDSPTDSLVASLPPIAPDTISSPVVESGNPVKTPMVPAPEATFPTPEPAVPTFTFGGANAPESSGGSKKIILGLLAVVLAGGAAYAGWQYYSLHQGSPVTIPAPSNSPSPGQRQLSTNPNTAPQPVKPSAPATAQTQPKASDTSEATNPSVTDSELNPDSTAEHAAPVSSKTPAKPAPAPLVVKGGSVHGIATKAAVPDAAAPSMIGLAGTSAPPPNLVNSASAPKPLLQRVSISQGVSQGLLVKKVSPVYPTTAMQMHLEGPVQLQATISKDGNITDIKTLSGDPTLVSAAKNAVKQWKYKPYLLNGEPVEIQTQITINFKLPQQ